MARIRVSTTVDEQLLAEARRLRPALKDAELLDEALGGLVRLHREVEIDAEYAAGYAAHPIDEPDDWGDLAAFRRSIGAKKP